MVKTFIKGSSERLSTNFSSREFDCHCEFDDCTSTLIDMDHVFLLQELRNAAGVLWITSAYRCQKFNAVVGGVSNSQHILGKATDIIPRDIRLSALLEMIDDRGFMGIGMYNTFVHLDNRQGGRARWNLTQL